MKSKDIYGNEEEKKSRKERNLEKFIKEGKLSALAGSGFLAMGLINSRLNDPTRPSNRDIDPEFLKASEENASRLLSRGSKMTLLGLAGLGVGSYQHYKYKKRKNEFKDKKNNWKDKN